MVHKTLLGPLQTLAGVGGAGVGVEARVAMIRTTLAAEVALTATPFVAQVTLPSNSFYISAFYYCAPCIWFLALISLVSVVCQTESLLHPVLLPASACSIRGAVLASAAFSACTAVCVAFAGCCTQLCVQSMLQLAQAFVLCTLKICHKKLLQLLMQRQEPGGYHVFPC